MVSSLKWLLVLLAMGAGTALAAPAPLDEGQQLAIFLHQHGYGTLKVGTESTNAQYVEALINGKSVNLAIDTGCDLTCLRYSCADDLDLDIHDTGKKLASVGGYIKGTAGMAIVNSFKLGGYEINRTNIVVVQPKGALTKNADGLLGYDFLHANAMILPVGAKFIFFKPGNAPAADIGTYMVAMGFKRIQLTHQVLGVVAQGHVNGAPFSAVIDCGASLSLFSLKFVVATAKVRVQAMASGPTGLDGRKMPTYLFTPPSIDIGSMNVLPEPFLAQFSPLLMAGKTDALIGYDFLCRHQAIIDLGHSILWMK